MPTEAVRAGVVAQGIAADRVVTSGLPVDASFMTPPDRPALRAAMGLAADVPVVLVTGGMRGLLRGVAEACEALASLDRPFVALAVCGDHLRLAARLRRRHWRDSRFRVLGHVTDMARLMGVADLVVSKAGAHDLRRGARARAAAPACTARFPGQEQANEAGLVAAGAALRARGARELRRRLDALLGEPDLRTALAATARSLRRPEAGRTVAKEMLALLGAGMIGRAGRWVGAGVGAWAAYAWGAQCALPAVAWRRGPAGGRRIALTFDDGPDPEATPRLLRAPGRARRPGHVLPHRRARRAEPRRGARDQGRGTRGREPHVAAPERVVPAAGRVGPGDHGGRAHPRGHPRATRRACTGLPGASSTRPRWRRRAGSGW